VRSWLSTITAFGLLLPSGLNAPEIVFSHRAYAAQGRSYQQLWSWAPDARILTQISWSGRDHLRPICESDRRHILFQDQDNGRRWRLDRVTGAEEPLNSTGFSADLAEEANRPRSAPRECDAGTARLSPDGACVACAVAGTEILIADAHTLQTVARMPFGQRYATGEPYAPWPMESIWSPDGRMLLVGNYGENGGSSTGELDYVLLDLTTKTWTRAFTGTDARWLRPDLIVYVTPRALSLLPVAGTHSVWTAHLTAFDPLAHTEQPITSGLSNDLHPSACLR
jgi:hypothetical protein